MNKYFIIFSLVVITQLSFGQAELFPGYIISNQFDTIWGQGNISNKQDYCLFRPFDKTIYAKYLPNELFGFRILNGRYYISKDIVTFERKERFFKKDSIIEIHNLYFLEYLLDGEVDLFMLRVSGGDRYFIENAEIPICELIYDKVDIIYKDGTPYFVKDNAYKGLLRVYMKDSPEIYPKIDNLRAQPKSLIKLAEEYHNNVCKDKPCINYTKSLPKIGIKIEPFIGLDFHDAFYTTRYGFFLNFWRPLRNEKLYLKIGMAYSSLPYYYSSDSIKKQYPKKKITIPIYWQYAFGDKKLKPTIGIGFINGFYLSSFQGGLNYSISDKIELSLNASIDGLLITLSNRQQEFFNNNLGHSFKIGLVYGLR